MALRPTASFAASGSPPSLTTLQAIPSRVHGAPPFAARLCSPPPRRGLSQTRPSLLVA